MPTFCVLVSSVSLTALMGLVAYDAGPIGVLGIGVLVFLVMVLQYILYGTQRLFTSALHIWSTAAALMVNVVEGFSQASPFLLVTRAALHDKL